jgi:hypothetical protein
MPRIAFYTFGILHESYGHPQVQGFLDRLESVFAQAHNSEGFIVRNIESQSDERAAPRFYDKTKHAAAPATLSLWKDLESVCAFAYRGLHGEALKIRSEWFVKPEWPTYVAWWVEDDHEPTREEASMKLEYLHDHGSSPLAFNFKKPFDASGQPVELNRQLLELRIKSNEDNTN